MKPLYENPDCVPLEELKLNVKSDGMIIAISALNARWMDNRYFLHYEEPEIYDDNGSEIMDAKEYWLEIVGYIIEDLNWLLELPFYQFWSNILYNTSIIDTLVSFLQEAPPFYTLENFPTIPEMLEALEKLRRNVLMVFARLITNKESLTEYMNQTFLANLLYNNYIFTIPIIFDLCQLYGRENAKVIERILSSLFTLQPLYMDDLQKSVPYLIQALRNVEWRFEDCPIDATEAIALSDRGGNSVEMTLCNLESLILYVLDLISTLTVLLKSYPSLTAVFHQVDFMNKILMIYGSTIPEMYKKLDKLAYNDDSMPKYIELKHRLDVTRVEMLNLYRIIIYEPVLNIQKEIETATESDIRNCVDGYFSLLMSALSEKEFITDYHQFYPIHSDLEVLSKICPEVDTIKCEYILDSLYASIGDSQISANAPLVNTVAVAEPSGVVQDDERKKDSNEFLHADCINNKEEPTTEGFDEFIAISKVKEILCDYGEGFIQLCLKHYNCNAESVIDAIIEDKLPSNLKEMDTMLPYIPPDPMEPSAAMDSALGIERLNIYDNDEFDIMTRDVIDTSRVYRGKKKEKYKDANEMLNDKSEIKKYKSIYEKYSIVCDDNDEYNDEYDDTYDSHDIRNNAPDDSVEGAKSLTTPKVLRVNYKSDTSSEDDSEVDKEKPTQNVNFIQNPEELRAKIEQRKQSARGNKNMYNVGKPKGQGQDKETTINKRKKNIHKASQSNHNRRLGSQMKRKQGMIPS